jgi:hypothetical protein
MQPLIAYLDESGTHGGSEIMVMGGFLARLDQWTTFEGKFAALKKKHGFRVLHMVDLKNRKEDFKGWSDDQIEALLIDLSNITSFHLADAIAVTLDNASFKEFYKLQSTNLDSPYGLCFRLALYYLLVQAIKRKHNKKLPALHIVLEDGHANKGGAERIFKQVQAEYKGIRILQSFRLVKKDECDPIMIADMAAWSTLKINLKDRAANAPPRESAIVPKGYVGITHLQSAPEALARMRQEAIELQKAHSRQKRQRRTT